MDPAIIAAVLAFIAIGGAGIALSGQPQPATAQKRVKALGGGQPADRRKQAVDTAALKRKQTTQEALKDLALSEKQSRRRRFSVKGQIAQAGMSLSITTFWVMAGLLGAVLAVIGLLVQGPIGAALGFFVGLFGLPRWILGMKVSGRQKKFTLLLADAIDIIVRGVKSGLPLNQCLRIIATESPEPLGGEFRALCDSLTMGVPLDQGLQRMYERMPLPDVNFFSIVLVIQQKTGGNLSESVKRAARAQADERKGQGALVGSQSLSYDYRRLAAHCHGHGVLHAPSLHFRAVYPPDGAPHLGQLRGDDVAGRFHHAQNGQLQILRRAAWTLST